MSRIIGIDLGTTNSVMACMEGEEPRIIPNDRGSSLTPSVVALTAGGELLVGEAAKNQAIINAEGTVRSSKRLMGREEPLLLRHRSLSPQEIAAHILKKLKQDSEAYLGGEVHEAVISVPAYFNEKQRRATIEAGRLAGFKVRRIINEPTAAALAHAAVVEGDARILVYDLGGGTFDVTILKAERGEFTVLATGGDNQLGGDDFDRLLLERVMETFSKESGIDISADAILTQQLADQVERAKIELSSRESALIALPFIGAGTKPVHLQYTVTRGEFEELIAPLLERTIDIARQTVKDAGIAIDTLILSGGSSRIPRAQRALEELVRVAPQKRVNPDEVVALGAAVATSIQGKDDEELRFHDVTPLPLGVEIEGGRFMEVVRRNAPVPSKEHKVFTTVAAGQRSVEVHVLQGNGGRAEENTSLGRFLLTGIAEAPQGEPKIEVTFRVDEDGILHVEASDRESGAYQGITISREFAGEDALDRDQLQEKLDSLIRRTEGLLQSLGGAIEASFIGEVEAALREARSAAESDERARMDASRLELETLVSELQVLGREGESFGGA
jgi:molecular chaperone DnaK